MYVLFELTYDIAESVPDSNYSDRVERKLEDGFHSDGDQLAVDADGKIPGSKRDGKNSGKIRKPDFSHHL